MKTDRSNLGWIKSLPIWVASALLVVQYILAFFVYKLPGWPPLQWIGWIIWVISLIFGIAPIFILRQKGGVAKGKSYVHTTRLVDTSLYAIVRHPQIVAGILFSLSMMLIAQHWLVIVLGCITMVLFYRDIPGVDQEAIEKFGPAYLDYMQRVPRANFLLGIYRLLTKKR